MATEETVRVHPGDIVQDHEGLLYLTTGTFNWGVGAVLRSRGNLSQSISEAYHRLKPGSFSVVGVAPMMPEAVAQARRDSLATEAAVARETGK